MAKVILARMDVAALLKLRGEIDRQLSTRRQQLESNCPILGSNRVGRGKGGRAR